MTKYMKIDDGPPVPYEPIVQLDINGNAQPVTWDGEPMYSPETVAEGLFDPEAFEQMPGQLAIDAFNARFERVSSPEAVRERAEKRAEYEARYEAMMARKRAERDS